MWLTFPIVAITKNLITEGKTKNKCQTIDQMLETYKMQQILKISKIKADLKIIATSVNCVKVKVSSQAT